MDYLLNRLMPYSIVVMLWLVPSFVSAANGIWQTIGYGYVFDLSDLDSPIVYDIGNNFCLPNHFLTEEAHQDGVAINEATRQINFDKLFPLSVTKLDNLPNVCSDSALTTFTDPEYVFDATQVLNVFFDHFTEHYAFSDYKNIDWKQLQLDWLQQVNESTSPQQLHDVIDKFLALLRDGHAILFDQSLNKLSYYPPREIEAKRRLSAFHLNHPEYATIADVYRYIYSNWIQIIESYFDADFLHYELQNTFLYARLQNDLSYLRIANFDENDAEQVMQALIPQFNETSGLVIDLRDSDGGSDKVALAISAFLINEPLKVSSKHFKLNSGENSQDIMSETRDIVVYPFSTSTSAPSTPYLGKIVVITSQHTPSAAELFLLALRARDNVSIIGENSSGAFSDALTKALPNGWGMTLSNESYIAPEGKSFEFVGIPVDEAFEFPSISDIKNRKDSALEHAISLLKD
ncbi:S41 family peptidase [Alteromonas stellipolaris]|uniref:S41 family peptidase n=1 Tax=Alteromonas stellipolaris TaxID=233316 RepID=UPI001DFF3A37|nr:S41 family peptidase [Alteromonas stellipolaris]MBZ2162620.1 S41 family peptidase [Alteromonas stellipolaris]